MQKIAARVGEWAQTAVDWSRSNPVLLAGEIGVELDTCRFKVGNGVDQWNDLGYIESAQTTYVAGAGIVINNGRIDTDLTYDIV